MAAAPSAGGVGEGSSSSAAAAAAAAATIGPHVVDEGALCFGHSHNADMFYNVDTLSVKGGRTELPPRVLERHTDMGISFGAAREGLSAAATAVAVAASVIGPHSSDEEAMWQMNLGEAMEAGPYPERIGEPDCSYYMRTGLCRMKGEYPQRIGQPECQYYLKTGTCKFGATCKFHHPREKAAMATRVQLNALGYPLRPNEKECAYYLRTGQCKFGSTCHSSYAQVIVPPGLVQVPGWNPYAAQIGSSSSDDQQRTAGGAKYYTGSRHSETPNMGDQGMFSSYQAGSVPLGLYTVQRESIFPERPDQPECQFYMKTGDCKFGAVCKFHHPKERIIPTPNCALSSLGLPLRPGEPICTFYSRYGICKFGPNCKFDHPMGTVMYGLPTSPTGDVSARRMLAPVPAHSEVSPDNVSGRSRRITHSDSQQIPSGERGTEREAS
uniref:C3H1-type domain-containing protein n=1 Tax=Oryza meridionalis TaxID=40149 RepID=A0A0E0F5M4_9ORYZ